MQQASLVGTIYIILIIVAIYYAFRLFRRYIFPWLMRLFLRRLQERMSDQMHNYQQQSRPTERTADGTEIVVDPAAKKTSSRSQLGKDDDYVDFEELSD